MIDRDRLTTYLNDHLAGSQVAISLLERLAPGEDLDVPGLLAEIRADREELEALIGDLGAAPSALRKAAGWLAEKAASVKLRSTSRLGRFEALELLSLGILGKRALWRTLLELEGSDLKLSVVRLEQLTERARAQFERVERARVASARGAFAARRAAR
jgi:hypothetical protein